MLVLAQISDLHLDGTERARERAARVLARLRAMPVDALLVTGDIADHGSETEYEQAAGLLDGLPFPVLTCPGNHDVRGPYRKALLGHAPEDGPVDSFGLVGGTAILMCDSSIPGEDDGRLSPATYDWIERTLDELGPEVPALLAFHHPPVALHAPLPDSYPLHEPGRLAALLERRPQIRALITGHAHTPAATVFAGRPVAVGPGVTWTLRLPWEGGDTVADRAADPGYALHVLDDEGRLTTHFRSVRADA
ncbi:phosphodiesterase [Streptomyces indicus]|uniref:3',5'-cyclic AMP phosphodiesterase CpdA n=1 Tax=Streptomyces indicus TaxID=417292 RepID=A0A1G8V8D1_9ACTN|nr:phosphodiesterase [Streptomyces indicus]SDJ62338.1 3',5'-cyclic AMP phosphodiesterase CpdA [Streptomyces indicus]